MSLLVGLWQGMEHQPLKTVLLPTPLGPTPPRYSLLSQSLTTGDSHGCGRTGMREEVFFLLWPREPWSVLFSSPVIYIFSLTTTGLAFCSLRNVHYMSIITQRQQLPLTFYHAHDWTPDSRKLQLSLQIGTFTASTKGCTRLPLLHGSVFCFPKPWLPLFQLTACRVCLWSASAPTCFDSSQKASYSPFLMSFSSLSNKVSSSPYHPLCLGQRKTH